MKTLLVGNFGAHNVGDELILCAALKDYPDAVVMTADSKASQKFCDLEFKTVPFPPTAFRSLWFYISDSAYRCRVHRIRRFDTIVFAGGGLFAIKLRACLLWFLVFKWLKFLNPAAEFRMEFQGVDQGLNGLSQKLTAKVFKAADFVSVRDEASKQALEALEVKNIALTQDRVWLWLSGLDLDLSAKAESSLLLINALDYGESVTFEVDHHLSTRYRKFVAFAPSDLKFAPLGIPAVLPQTKQEVFDLFSSAEQAVGERLHFLIVAQVFADDRGTVSLLRKPYAEKVKSFTSAHDITLYESD